MINVSIGLLIGLSLGVIVGTLMRSLLVKETLDELVAALFGARAALLGLGLGRGVELREVVHQTTLALIRADKLPHMALKSVDVMTTGPQRLSL